MANDFTTQVPYTDVKPLKIDNDQSQFYDWSEKVWKEAVTQDISDKLDLLEKLNEGAKVKIEELDNKVAKQEQETLDTQQAIAEVYEQILGGA